MFVTASVLILRSLPPAGPAAVALMAACSTDSAPTPPATQAVRVFLVSRGDGGRNGILLPCNDSAVPVRVMLPADQPPVQGALRFLFDLDPRTLETAGLMHPLVHSQLSVVSVEIDEGRAKIHLTGRLRAAPWPCNRERIRAQIEQTALQFEDIRHVEVFVDGRPLAELLAASQPSPLSAAPEASSALPGGAAEPLEGPGHPRRER